MNLKTSFIKMGLLVISIMPLVACAPKTYVTLLNNADGSVGEVTVQGPKGETVLNTANTGANLDGSTKKAFPVDAEQLQDDFGNALKAQPELPENFLLYFEEGGTKLTEESAKLIPIITNRILTRKGVDISIIGHSDTTGAADINERLSQERAAYISGFFNPTELQIKEMTVTSHGEKNLLVKTEDNVSEPRNRRVEINVR